MPRNYSKPKDYSKHYLKIADDALLLRLYATVTDHGYKVSIPEQIVRIPLRTVALVLGVPPYSLDDRKDLPISIEKDGRLKVMYAEDFFKLRAYMDIVRDIHD